jgi:hypothetical protein
MATLTIDVNPELLERAKQHAAARNTTVDCIVEEQLATLPETSSCQLRIFEALQAWAKEHPFSVDPKSYTREELHERG